MISYLAIETASGQFCGDEVHFSYGRIKMALPRIIFGLKSASLPSSIKAGMIVKASRTKTIGIFNVSGIG